MKTKQIIFLLTVICLLCGCNRNENTYHINETQVTQQATINDNSINTGSTINDTITESAYARWNEFPEYTGQPYTTINNNIPRFTEQDITTQTFEHYSDLDGLGRCGIAWANICQELMPTAERGEIGHIKPSGWHTVNYHELIDGNYLYNRCHLIGFQLAGENDNEKNLITGTRYLNVDGMLPFENKIANYVKTTNNHVVYRVSPVFYDNELVCRGVLLEAQSVENNGCVFCVYCFNVQPGIDINYATGDSQISTNEQTTTQSQQTTTDATNTSYILNTKSIKIHRPDCSAVNDMSDYNKQEYTGDINNLIKQGYTRCKMCNPQ